MTCDKHQNLTLLYAGYCCQNEIDKEKYKNNKNPIRPVCHGKSLNPLH